MAFSVLDMLNQSSVADISKSKEYKEIVLQSREIVVTTHNKYSMEELQELATGIELDGLQEPLILGKVNKEYWLVSGHRRYAAIQILLQEDKEQYSSIPCRYKEMSETEFRIALLIGNTFNRKMTDYDLMVQAREWKEVLTQAKNEKLIKLENGKRIRDYVAAVLGETTGKIGTLEAINNNATKEIKEQLKEGNIGITTAYEASKLEEETQNEIVGHAESLQDTRNEEIQKIIEEKKEEKELKKLEKIKTQHVSDSDTNEEEKENAKNLHVLKMLEKYYIYMNEEERNILERILEDCKRRKREYALEEE